MVRLISSHGDRGRKETSSAQWESGPSVQFAPQITPIPSSSPILLYRDSHQRRVSMIRKWIEAHGSLKEVIRYPSSERVGDRISAAEPTLLFLCGSGHFRFGRVHQFMSHRPDNEFHSGSGSNRLEAVLATVDCRDQHQPCGAGLKSCDKASRFRLRRYAAVRPLVVTGDFFTYALCGALVSLIEAICCFRLHSRK